MTPSVVTIVIFFVFLGVVSLLVVWYFFHVVSMLRGAPYVESKKKNIEFAKAVLANQKKIADIGSGDGSVLLALAETTRAELHGYEINPLLVLYTKWRIKRAGLASRVFVHWQDIWSQNFHSFDGIYVYMLPSFLGRLSSKLKTKLPPQALIVSACFPFRDQKPLHATESAFLYTIEK